MTEFDERRLQLIRFDRWLLRQSRWKLHVYMLAVASVHVLAALVLALPKLPPECLESIAGYTACVGGRP